MRRIIHKTIGILQIIGGLVGLIFLIKCRRFEAIPVLFLTLNLIAGAFLVTNDKIGNPISLLILLPQLVHIYSENGSLFEFSTPISFGILLQPELTIGLYASQGFTAIYEQGFPNSFQINLLALAGVIYLWKNYDNTQNQPSEVEPTVKMPVELDNVQGTAGHS